MINNCDEGTGILDFQVLYSTYLEVHDMINNIDDGPATLDFQVKNPTNMKGHDMINNFDDGKVIYKVLNIFNQ